MKYLSNKVTFKNQEIIKFYKKLRMEN